MASSGYVADTFVAGEQPTTSKWNELWSNDASFNNGNGFNDNILVSRHFATSGLQLPDKTFNPYKFRVHLATGQTITSNTFTKIPFETRDFDTGSNVDITTNKGRFTAPIAGFYQFNANAENSSGSAARNLISFYKNGVEYSRGNDSQTSAQAIGGAGISDFIQLAATDYIEVYFQTSGSTIAGTNTDGAYATYFSGFLVSAT